MTKHSISRLAFFAAFLTVAATGTHRAQAQAPTVPHTQAEFEQALGITPAQKTKMLKINKLYQPKFMALQQKYKPQFDALQQQLNELRKRYASEAAPLQAALVKEQNVVLTPAQRQKVAQIQAAEEAQMRARMAAPTGVK